MAGESPLVLANAANSYPSIYMLGCRLSWRIVGCQEL